MSIFNYRKKGRYHPINSTSQVITKKVLCYEQNYKIKPCLQNEWGKKECNTLIINE